MTTEAIKSQIARLSRKEQAEIVHFIMDIIVSDENFELSPELRAEIDASYHAIETEEDKGFSPEAYREEMRRFFSSRKQS